MTVVIESYTFGKFVVDGKEYDSNIIIINEKVKSCRHFDNHEVFLDDFTDLVESHPSYIIIGTGAYGVIVISQDIKDYITGRNIRLIIKKTADACDEYNRLTKEGRKVAVLLHNTC